MVPVRSAEEMAQAVGARAPGLDVVVMAAAVLLVGVTLAVRR